MKGLADWAGQFIFILILVVFAIVVWSVTVGPFKSSVCTYYTGTNLDGLIRDARQGSKIYPTNLNLGDCITKIQLKSNDPDCSCSDSPNANARFLCVHLVNEKTPQCVRTDEVNIDLGEFKDKGLTEGSYRVQVDPLNIRVLNRIS